jgi:hypothetical protein
MSSDLYVQALTQGRLRVRHRQHVSGEVMICFNDPNVKPILISDDNILNVSDHGVSTYEIQRSNIRTLIGTGYLEVVM